MMGKPDFKTVIGIKKLLNIMVKAIADTWYNMNVKRL